MIKGHKPGGYFVTSDGEGRKVEGETRQCCHCQFIWTYRPGSGDRRGWCLKHSGFLCARPECAEQQLQILTHYLNVTGKAVTCLSFEEWNDFLMNQAAPRIAVDEHAIEKLMAEGGKLIL